MDTQLKQRLIGAIVLVSLGVIFIPVLLDGAGYKSRHARSIEIPDEPKFPPLTQLKIAKIKTPLQVRQEKSKAEPKSIINQKSSTVKAPLMTTKMSEPVTSWALQVGTFSEKSNALVLQDKLRADKHPAYVSAFKANGKQSYKVRIGPIVNKKRVETLKQTIKKTHNLAGYIVQHP